jgi:hypothetical protein
MPKPFFKFNFDDAIRQLKEVRVFKNEKLSLLVGILWHIIVFIIFYLAIKYLYILPNCYE